MILNVLKQSTLPTISLKKNFLIHFQRVRPTAMALIVPENAGSVTLDKFVMPSLGNVAGDVRQGTAGSGVTKVRGGGTGTRRMGML